MELYWQGKNITGYVEIVGCVHRDKSHGRSDSLELTMDHASVWYRWKPEEDDEIVVTEGNHSTGKMYLNTVIPERDKYRVIATGMRRDGIRQAWKTYENITLEKLFDQVASEARMAGKLYGVDGDIRYGYLLRKKEGCGAFLDRIGGMEGLMVKTANGAIRGIALQAAQEREPTAVIRITAKQEGIIYRRQANRKYSRLTVQTPYGSATARDAEAAGENELILTQLPVENSAQAGRWARNLLAIFNRQTEEIALEQTLNTRLMALERVNVTGGTDMDGRWMVEEAEHDLYNRRTAVRLLRVVDSIV